MKSLKVSRTFPLTNVDDKDQQTLQDNEGNIHMTRDHEKQNFSTYVMLSKPIFALKFNQMKMQVEAPIVLYHCPNSLEPTTFSSVP